MTRAAAFEAHALVATGGAPDPYLVFLVVLAVILTLGAQQ